jgi:hypothetical protein
MDGLLDRQDQVKVLADGDRVHVWVIGLLRFLGEDLLQFSARHKAATQARDDRVRGISAQADRPSWAIGDGPICTSGCSQHSISGSGGKQSTSQVCNLSDDAVAR